MTRSHLEAVAARAADAAIPLQVHFELTQRCHLACRHCYLPPSGAPEGELKLDAILRILSDLRAAGALFVTLTGGEIFLRHDVLEIASTARQLGFAVRLFTSGTLLRQEQINTIARLRLTAVELSLYGVSAASHDGVTGTPRSFRRTLRAAVALRRAGVPVVLKTPLLRSLGDAPFDLPRLARRLGAGVRLDPSVIPPGRATAMAPTRQGPAAPAERPPLASVAQLFREHGPAVALPAAPPAGAATCAIARRVVRIGSTGLVYPCALYPEPAGDLRTTSFRAIWRNAPLLRRLRTTTVAALRGECAGCQRIGYCGRCSALALIEHGDALGPNAEACDRAAAMALAAGDRPT